MIQVEFYIPMRQSSSGKLHAATTILELERFLEEFGGFTLHGTVQGSWRDPDIGESVREESFHYSVAVSKEGLTKLRAFMRERGKIIFDQKAIYFNVGGKVEFL